MTQADARSGLTPGQAALIMAATFAAASVTLTIARWTGASPDTISLPMLAFGTVIFTAVGVVVLWRRPGHGIGRLALLIGLCYALVMPLQAATELVDPPGPVAALHDDVEALLIEASLTMANVLQSAGLLLGCTLLISWFPDGRRTSRLGICVELALVVGAVAILFDEADQRIIRAIGWTPLLEGGLTLARTIGFPAMILALVLAVVDLALRYRRADPLRQTQMRWVLAASVVALGSAAAGLGLVPLPEDSWDVWILTLMAPVVAIAVAITRYHLYDIDRIVSRTISYTVVTAILFGVFALINLGLQTVFSGILGNPPVVVATSTLAVAALFNPLRRRVQAVVDRRFHRARYDAERTVASFAERLRDELDLAALSTELRSTTIDAVAPVSTSIWLRATRG